MSDTTVEAAGYTLSTLSFERQRDLVYQHAGIALRDEKHQLVCSRLGRRLRAQQLTSFDDDYHRCVPRFYAQTGRVLVKRLGEAALKEVTVEERQVVRRGSMPMESDICLFE